MFTISGCVWPPKKLADAKNFISDIGRSRIGVNCGEDHLQDKCCLLEIFSYLNMKYFCQFVTDCVT